MAPSGSRFGPLLSAVFLHRNLSLGFKNLGKSETNFLIIWRNHLVMPCINMLARFIHLRVNEAMRLRARGLVSKIK
jgi:hypothetical protein